MLIYFRLLKGRGLLESEHLEKGRLAYWKEGTRLLYLTVGGGGLIELIKALT